VKEGGNRVSGEEASNSVKDEEVSGFKVLERGRNLSGVAERPNTETWVYGLKF